LIDTVKAVLSGFAGVRRRADAEQAKLNPVHVIILAVVGVVLFIFAIRAVVHLVAG
jgi:hypothetical protein